MRRTVLAILVVIACRPTPSSLRDPASPDPVAGSPPGPLVLARSRAAARAPGAELGYLAPPPGGALAGHALGGMGGAVASALRDGYRAGGEQPASPMALIPSDGTELALRKLDADIRIQGPLAHTELHLVFTNPEPRQREGRFSLELPLGAAVSRFAMKVGATWREARVVSRTQGRTVYETFLHRKVDPALLERDADHRFSARVFPIAEKADKEIIIGYDHVVGAAAPYVLPLRGLPAVEISIAIDQDGAPQRRTSQDAPDDLVLAIAPGNAAVDSDEAFVARIDPFVAGTPEQPAAVDSVLVLVDTSASRAALMARQAEAVRRLLAVLPAGSSVEVAAYDHAVHPLYRGAAGQARGVAAAVLEHGALGASRLAAALDYAAHADPSRVVLIGDAVATLGERDPRQLAQRVAGVVHRIDVLQLGGSLDRAAAQAIVGAGVFPGAILDGRNLDAAIHQVLHDVRGAERIAIEGIEQMWPATTRGIGRGEPIFVYGLYRPGARPRGLRVDVGSAYGAIAPQRGDPTAVRRAVASAQVAALEDELAATADPPAAAQLRAEIERIALAHGLVSSQTSLLTLESDADERRMLGPAPAAPAVEVPTVEAPAAQAPSAAGAAELSDADLAKLAAQEAKTEVITITGSLIARRELSIPGGFSIADERERGRPRASGDTLFDAEPGPSWGEASPQRPSVFMDRWRMPWADREYRPPPSLARRPPADRSGRPPARREPGASPSPRYVGALAEVMAAIARRDCTAAIEIATRAQLDHPGDVTAILALGEALEAAGASALAARAYGSLIDLYPSRDDLIRAAGERLDRIAGSVASVAGSVAGSAGEIAVDAYRRAVAERPDRAVSYRRLGYALVRLGRWSEALDALIDGLPRADRSSVSRILQEDVGLVAAAAIAAVPREAKAIRARLARLGVALPSAPSLRFVLTWETDANDVDLHVLDGGGSEAYYGVPALPSGGALLEDITTGFGPEMLSIERPDAFPYRLGVHYYARGPEGVGLGAIQILEYDGRGGLSIEDRPFALQVDGARIDLGAVER